MNRIFCLETEWDLSIHDLKRKPTVLALLDFMEKTRDIEVPYVYRQVATEHDFNYYIDHLYNASYAPYDVVYLCFHGDPGLIQFADLSTFELERFKKEKKGIFAGRAVIFDSCSTLSLQDDEVLAFKRATGARMVIGYTEIVNFIDSWVFEMWLLNTLHLKKTCGPKRLMQLAEKEMPVHCKKLGFRVY